jgi:hypothetical protein
MKQRTTPDRLRTAPSTSSVNASSQKKAWPQKTRSRAATDTRAHATLHDYTAVAPSHSLLPHSKQSPRWGVGWSGEVGLSNRRRSPRRQSRLPKISATKPKAVQTPHPPRAIFALASGRHRNLGPTVRQSPRWSHKVLGFSGSFWAILVPLCAPRSARGPCRAARWPAR